MNNKIKLILLMLHLANKTLAKSKCYLNKYLEWKIMMKYLNKIIIYH